MSLIGETRPKRWKLDWSGKWTNGDSEEVTKVIWNMQLCIVVIQFNCALLSSTRSEEKRVYSARGA